VPSYFIAAAASVALAGAGFPGPVGTRSVEALPAQTSMLAANEAGSGDRCKIEVARTGTPGAADITRSVLADGSCVCTVTTGQPATNGGAEDVVIDLLRNRTCDGAPAPGKVVSKVATAGGGAKFLLPLLLSTIVAAVLAVSGGKSDSKG
jgi:hypothetical protein